MAQYDVIMVSTEIGALSNAITPIARVASAGGGITILTADVISRGDATTSLFLVDLGASGTAVAGTIASFAGTLTAKVPAAGTLVTAFVDDGRYIGVKEGNAGAANAVTNVTFSYVMGR